MTNPPVCEHEQGNTLTVDISDVHINQIPIDIRLNGGHGKAE